MGNENADSTGAKKNWKDYFDVFKYFIPFFIYFAVIWLQSEFATKDELIQTNVDLVNAVKLSERAIEDNKDLENSIFYEIRIMDTKLDNISKELTELKKFVEETHQKQ